MKAKLSVAAPLRTNRPSRGKLALRSIKISRRYSPSQCIGRAARIGTGVMNASSRIAIDHADRAGLPGPFRPPRHVVAHARQLFRERRRQARFEQQPTGLDAVRLEAI